MLLPSGTVSTCESNLCRRRCSPHSMYIIYVQLHPCHIWVNQAACGVSTSYDALVTLFERVGDFLKRLHIYTEIPFTPALTDIIVRIMVEVLSVLALATKEVKWGRFSKCIPSPLDCHGWTFCRKIFKETVQREQDRSCATEIVATH